MMTKLREMTFIFIWVLVFAFVGLMVFEWGMNFTGLKGRSNVVGSIEGQKITIQEFQKEMQNAYIREKQQTGTEPNEEKMNQLRDQVWNSYIQRILYAKEIAKRDIKVTDHELFLQIYNNPTPDVRQNENLQTDGKFDINKYHQALQNPNVDLSGLENYYRFMLPYQKLQDIITAAVMVTEEEVKAEYLAKNQKAKIEYLHIPVSAFIKDSIAVTDQEVENYYNAHKEDFAVEEKRKLNYVLFSTEPSAQDSQKVYNLAEDVKKEALAGTDFAQLADEYSEDPSVKKNHGDLGYFERGRMVKEFSAAAFSGKAGDIVGPVKTNFGLHLIKIWDKKVEKGQEQVHASHILFKFTPSALTLENAQEAAKNFYEMAKDEGFHVTADKLKYEVRQTPEFAKRNYIPAFGVMPSAVKWTFKAEVHDISRVYHAKKGYLVFELAEISPAGYQPFSEVKEICKNRLVRDKRKEIARQYAEEIQQKLDAGKTFSRVFAEDSRKIIVHDSTNEITIDQVIPRIGRSSQIYAAAFSLEPGKISPLLDTPRGFYFVKVLERTPFDEADYKQKREGIRAQLLNTKRQKFFTEWYENLKDKADIEDNRDQFFAS